MTFRFLTGHGTENDFVLLPDPDGSVHGDLAPGLVAALCHRRAGLGADGVMRVVRWTMTGPKTVLTRVMGIFTSMDKMIGPDFEKGLTRLKADVEA